MVKDMLSFKIPSKDIIDKSKAWEKRIKRQDLEEIFLYVILYKGI